MGCKGSTTTDGKIIKSNIINEDIEIRNIYSDQIIKAKENIDILPIDKQIESEEDDKPEKKRPPKIMKY